VPNAQPLKIFLSCSEYAPMAKTGGLADVTAALSDYFHAMGQEIRVLVPYYGGLNLEGRTVEPVTELQDLHMLLGDRAIAYRIIRSVPAVPGPDVYLLDCPQLYGTEELYSGPDEHLRFILLSRASIEMCQRLQFEPDIFHCHDWHTALIPVYLKSIYAWDQMFANSRTVLTLHNIGYQGVFGTDVLAAAGLGESMDLLDPEDLDGGRINFLRSGVMHANLLTTVSPTYAREIMEPELGMGLERQLRSRSESVVGILNGVDYGEWDPENDPLIPYSYSARKPAGKERNKRAVLEEMGLEYRFDRPLVGMISRLTYQKGIELVKEVVPGLLSERDFSLLALGSGEEDHEQFFHWLQDEFPDRVGFYRGFNNGLAHRIEAAVTCS
jgi:starch synthase